MGGRRVALSSFYEWFYRPFGILMAELAQRGIEAVQAVEKQRPEFARPDALLERLRDVVIVDSTSKLLGKLEHLWAPSIQPARGGIKLHAVTSLDSPIIHRYETATQTTHDSKCLRAEQFAPGTLALYDLGTIDHPREAAMNERGVLFLRHLKDTENPRIVKLVQAEDTGDAQGHRLRDALRDDRFTPGHIVDLDARVAEAQPHQFDARVVGVEAPDGNLRWYLTKFGSPDVPVGGLTRQRPCSEPSPNAFSCPSPAYHARAARRRGQGRRSRLAKRANPGCRRAPFDDRVRCSGSSSRQARTSRSPQGPGV